MNETSITVSGTEQAQWEILHPEQPSIKARHYELSVWNRTQVVPLQPFGDGAPVQSRLRRGKP